MWTDPIYSDEPPSLEQHYAKLLINKTHLYIDIETIDGEILFGTTFDLKTDLQFEESDIDDSFCRHI